MTTQLCSRCFKHKDIVEFKNKWKTCEICRTYNRNYLREYYKDKSPTQKKPNLKVYNQEYYMNNKEHLLSKSKKNCAKKRLMLLKTECLVTQSESPLSSPNQQT